MTNEEQVTTPSKISDYTLFNDLSVQLSENNWGVEWDKPIPFEQPKLPILNLDAFPQTFREMILTVTDNLETPPDLQAMFGLGVMSTTLQSKFTVNPWSNWIEGLSLYTAVFLGASTRKTASFKAMMKPIYKFEEELKKSVLKQNEKNQLKETLLKKKIAILEKKYLETSDEAIFEEIKKFTTELNKFRSKPEPFIVVDDLTEESLIQKMAENNEKIAILSSEGNLLERIKSPKFDLSKLFVYLKAYSQDPISVIRISQSGETLYNPHLVICIAAQPSVLQEIRRELISRGFLPRFLLSLPYDGVGLREGGIRPPMDENVVEKYNELVTKMISLSTKEPIKLTYSTLAQQRLAEFDKGYEKLYRHEGPLAGELREWGGKFIGQLVKLTGLFHIVSELENNPSSPIEELSTVIEEDLVVKVLSLKDYFMQHTSIAYGVIKVDHELIDAEYLLEKIISIQVNTLATSNDIWQKTKYRFQKREDLNKCLKILADRGYIKAVTIPSKNKRSTKAAYIVNPLVLSSKHTKH